VALGSVGKRLPSALVGGRAAQVADSFTGLGACAGRATGGGDGVGAQVGRTHRRRDHLGSDAIGQADTKWQSDVTMPGAVWMFWNVACHRRGPAEVLDVVAAIARRALANTMAMLPACCRTEAGGAALPRSAGVALRRPARGGSGKAP
jgi:arginine utilization protein RocB